MDASGTLRNKVSKVVQTVGGYPHSIDRLFSAFMLGSHPGKTLGLSR